MIRLTLRTLLAYLDDTLPAADAKVIGQKLAENEQARELAERIRVLSRKRSLSTPTSGPDGSSTDPNVVAAYLSDNLSADQLAQFEKVSLESDVSLAELAACHQILTLLLSDQVRVPPAAYRRMYALVKGRESVPGRAPSRQAVPVGGVSPAERTAEADEADAAYLLGLPAYRKNEPFARTALRWGVAGLLACGFLVASWLAWRTLPHATTSDPLASAPTPTEKQTDAPPTPPTPKETPKPAEPPKDEIPNLPDPPRDHPKDEVANLPDPPRDRPKPVEPKEELGGAQPPIQNRVAVGVCESGDEQVLLFRKPDAEEWGRVKKGAEVQGTDRLVCLPGYRSKVQFKGGVTTELWANVPDLLPVPVFATAITPHVPYDGFAADFTLHAGRVYLNNATDRAAVVRVRVRDPKFPAKDTQWDITLADKTSEVVVEVGHRLVAGAFADPPRSLLLIHTQKGTATLPVKRKPTTIKAGEVLVFDSAKGEADGPKKPDAQAGGLEYFDRLAVSPDAARARPTLSVLTAFADRVRDAKSIPAVVEEFRAAPTPGTDQAVYIAGARWSVFASGALGDLPVLADLLNDPNRPGVRADAFASLRELLAASPDRADTLRTIAKERWKLSPAEIDAFLGTVAGCDEKKRKDADTLKKLVEQLSADEVAEREAALFVLLTEVDPSDKPRPVLEFDVAGPAAARAAGVAAWKKRVAELTK